MQSLCIFPPSFVDLVDLTLSTSPRLAFVIGFDDIRQVRPCKALK